MVSRITAALAARYKAIQEKEKGFTLIELLVVVIIIGVLAAIAIPIYLGVQNNAKDSAVQSDLSNVKIAVVAAYTNDPEYKPSGTLDIDANIGDSGKSLADLGATKSATYTGTGGQAPTVSGTSAGSGDATGTDFCIQATSGETGSQFHVTSTAGVSSGPCSTPAED